MKIKSFLKTQLRDFAILMAIGLSISTIFTGFGLWTSISAIKTIALYSFVIGISLWKGNELFARFFDKQKEITGIKPSTSLILDFTATIVISSLAIVIVNYFFFPKLFGITMAQNPKLFFIIAVIQLFISLFISSVFIIKEFFHSWMKSTLSEEKLKREALILQYEALKSNVNPHFLFNSLSVLSSLVDTDAEKAKQFIQQFSDIYRYVLEQRDKEVVSVEEEIVFIKSFINLHQLRHDSGLNVSIEVENMSGYIVPLSLQILLENCFKHNIISEEKPLMVKVWREDEYIVVQNNLQKRRIVQKSSGVGLDTIIRRYEYLTEKKIVVEQEENHYLVNIPILQDIVKD